MQKETGIFTISLDFELHWGLFDIISIDKLTSYFDNTIDVIPEILKVFEAYDVEATWAIVGMLFHESMDELKQNMPDLVPSYEDKILSAYEFISSSYNDSYSKYYFAPELVKQIAKTKGQEVGTHTYSHYYTFAEGQTKEQFQEDIAASVRAAEALGVSFSSIVYPRNQYLEKYNSVCEAHNITICRINPKIWFWDASLKYKFVKKIVRTLDCYLPLCKTSYKLDKEVGGTKNPLLLRTSRFYKPRETNKILNKLKLLRVKREMKLAAKKGEYYHLWWHPHNFGTYPQQSIEDLKEILEYYKVLNAKYGFKSLNMANTEKLLSKK